MRVNEERCDVHIFSFSTWKLLVGFFFAGWMDGWMDGGFDFYFELAFVFGAKRRKGNSVLYVYSIDILYAYRLHSKKP